MTTDATTDPVAELATAQRRIKRRMLVGAAIGAVAIAAGAVALMMCRHPDPAVPPIARPYLWKVTGAGAPSYLFGTMHVGYGVDDLPKSVLDAQAAATIVVSESDLLAAPTTIPTLDAADGRRRLDDQQWTQLARVTGIDRAQLETWTTAHLLGAVLASLVRRVEPMDIALQKRAVALGKPLAFLETRELEQVMSEGAVLDGVREALAHRGAARAQMRKIMAGYASGTETGASSSVAATDDLTARLNADWAPAIEDHVRRGGAFVFIGSGHLVGAGSIVERLRAKGLDVQRVR